ncbi:LOW QUALITY PROTEIN: hypothetical protein CRUP_007012 [Coryphaenoides rupestris]|nr:LOW QUALITY PROTEIN: hypothetical protein CRUP_007012 [Coryphaenoides rupestris]
MSHNHIPWSAELLLSKGDAPGHVPPRLKKRRQLKQNIAEKNAHEQNPAHHSSLAKSAIISCPDERSAVMGPQRWLICSRGSRGSLPQTQVGADDSLNSIALKFNITPNKLVQLNKLFCRSVYTGQKLFVPDLSLSEAATPTPQPAVVNGSQEGESNGRPAKPIQRHTSPPSEDESPATVKFIKMSCKYFTDGMGVVGGVLIVTPNNIMFDPHKSDPLVIEHGCEEYGLICPMEEVVSVALYDDVSRMRLKDAPPSPGEWEKLPSVQDINPFSRYQTLESKRPIFLDDIPSNFSESGSHGTPFPLRPGRRRPCKTICASREGKPSADEEEEEDEAWLRTAQWKTGNPTGRPPWWRSGGWCVARRRRRSPALKWGKRNLTSSTGSPEFVSVDMVSGEPKEEEEEQEQRQQHHHRTPAVKGGLGADGKRSPVGGAPGPQERPCGEASGLNEEERRKKTYEAETCLLPSEEKSKIPPMFLCFKLGKPMRKSFAVAMNSTSPAHTYGGRGKQPEYWFAVPQERVDHLYAFFVQWSPDVYGKEAREQGFVVVDELDMIDNFFSDPASCSWEIITIDEAKRRQSFSSFEAELSVDALPVLAESSALLQDTHVEKLACRLPARVQGYPWRLAYSSQNHGTSLKTLYRKLLEVDNPVLLVYRWTGDNSYFVKGNIDSLQFGGGGGQLGLWLDAELYRGTTSSCVTFNNQALSAQQDFNIHSVEVWTFE